MYNKKRNNKWRIKITGLVTKVVTFKLYANYSLYSRKIIIQGVAGYLLQLKSFVSFRELSLPWFFVLIHTVYINKGCQASDSKASRKCVYQQPTWKPLCAPKCLKIISVKSKRIKSNQIVIWFDVYNDNWE